MENLNTGLKHRNDLLSAIMECDDMTIQYLCELIEEHNLDVSEAIYNARQMPSGLTFDTIILYMLVQTFINIFIDVRADFDPDDEYDLDELKFSDRYINIQLNKMDSKITIKKDLAIQEGWPKKFINQLLKRVVDI